MLLDGKYAHTGIGLVRLSFGVLLLCTSMAGALARLTSLNIARPVHKKALLYSFASLRDNYCHLFHETAV